MQSSAPTSVKNRRFFSIIAIVLLLVFAFLTYAAAGIQHTLYLVVAPSVLVFAFLAIPNLSFNKYIKITIALYLWIAFTVTTAVDYTLALRELRRIVGCIMMILAVNQLSKDQRFVPWLYFVFIAYYLGIVYYGYTHLYTPSFDYTSERFDDSILGANTIAYFTFYATFAIFILANLVKNRTIRLILRILFILSPIWSFLMAILSGSRQVLIIQFPLIAILLYQRYYKNKSSLTKFVFVIVTIVVSIVAIQKGFQIYENSLLYQRTMDSSSNDPRVLHIVNAIQTGLDHPLVGVGPGNYGVYVYGTQTFSHSTYLELFANTGFPGLLLFIYLILSFITTQWKRYRKYKDSVYLLFWLFGLLFAVDNAFYVFYTGPWLMSFFFLVAGHSENYYHLHRIS